MFSAFDERACQVDRPDFFLIEELLHLRMPLNIEWMLGNRDQHHGEDRIEFSACSLSASSAALFLSAIGLAE